jgi:hypothetical protein
MEIKEDTTDADPIDIGVKPGETARLFDIFLYMLSKTSDQHQFPVERLNEAVIATLWTKKVPLLKYRFSFLAKIEEVI